MYTFVNGFKCATKRTDDVVAIQFLQDCPVFNENGVCETVIEDVASIIMSRETVAGLIDALKKLVDASNKAE